VKSYVRRPDLLNDKQWRRGFRLLREFGFSFDLQLYPSQMSDAADLAQAHPETLIILDHAGDASRTETKKEPVLGGKECEH